MPPPPPPPPQCLHHVRPDPSWGGGFWGGPPPSDPGENAPPLRAGRQAGTEYVYSLFRLARRKLITASGMTMMMMTNAAAELCRDGSIRQPPKKKHQMLDKVANRVARGMNNEQIYDLVCRFPVLQKLPRFEWEYRDYDGHRDVHRSVLARLHVYLWLELSRYLSAGELWCLQLALPGLFKIEELVRKTRNYRRENPFECAHCKIRTKSAVMLRGHVLMNNDSHAPRGADDWWLL